MDRNPEPEFGSGSVAACAVVPNPVLFRSKTLRICSNLGFRWATTSTATSTTEIASGFRWDRGTIGGLFTTCLGLSKRKEHGLETWALFIDLVKAFDSVPREALFAVLCRYGMPDHFVKVLNRLHFGAKI